MIDKYMIIGQTPDGVEHFINVSMNEDSYLKMLLRTFIIRHKKRFKARYSKIYLKKITPDFIDFQTWKYADNFKRGKV